MKHKLEQLLRAHPPIRFAVDVVDVYFSKRVSRAAAELAFFLILTFFPIMICISAFVNELHLDLTALLDQADPFLPQGVLVLFRDYLTYIDTNQSSAMLLSGAFLTVLFASAAVRGLMNIMHELYGRATFRGLGQLVASVLFSALLLATSYLSLAVVVTGNWFFHLLGQVLRLEGLVELMTEACACSRKTIRINQWEMPSETVRRRFLGLDSRHIRYVLESMDRNTSLIGNIRSYLLSALFNAPATISQYYASLVGYEMSQGQGRGG